MIFWTARRFRAPPTRPWHAIWPWSNAVHNLSPIPDRPAAPASSPPPTCDHKWIFAGVVYLPTSMNQNGRNYEDHYFCERCLEQKYLNLRNQGNKYDSPINGTMPK